MMTVMWLLHLAQQNTMIVFFSKLQNHLRSQVVVADTNYRLDYRSLLTKTEVKWGVIFLFTEGRCVPDQRRKQQECSSNLQKFRQLVLADCWLLKCYSYLCQSNELTPRCSILGRNSDIWSHFWDESWRSRVGQNATGNTWLLILKGLLLQ